MIFWTGDNLGSVLAYTGHKDVVINSFGNPCVRDLSTGLFVVCVPGEWITRLPATGELVVLRVKEPGDE